MTVPGTSFEALQPGLRGTARLVVGAEHTAQHLGSGGVQVLATPQMVLLMEQAGVAAVDHLLPEGYLTVGAHLDVRHLAPTPLGFEVEAVAELAEVDGRHLTFHVKVREGPFDAPTGRQEGPADRERGGGILVGEGTHQRIVINLQRFRERVALKAK